MNRTAYIALAAAVIALTALLFVGIRQGSQKAFLAHIQTYEDCVQAGFPSLDSNPAQCTTPDGRTFTELVSVPPQATSTASNASSTLPQPGSGVSASTSGSTASGTPVAAACKPSGCSGEICSDTNQVSNCIYRREFACYKETFAKCERQASGQCGWTKNNQLTACLSDGGPQ